MTVLQKCLRTLTYIPYVMRRQEYEIYMQLEVILELANGKNVPVKYIHGLME
jgi:hypothetical protein